MFIRGILFTAVALTASTAGLCAAEIGMVVAVEGRAVAVRDGQQIGLQRRSRIETDDIIATAEKTTVQLVFSDRTRMVVGPSSQLDLADVRFNGSGKTSRFVVEAVSGTFRFLSGDSPKQAYNVKTPTATMGIRGTVFDFSVRGRRPTSLVTLEGEVRMCGRRGRCARVIGGCAVAIALPRRIEVPADKRARDALLRGSHPYVVSQDSLQPEFRAPVASCGEISRVIRGIPDSVPTRAPRRAAPEVQRALPATEAPPPEPPAPEPDPDPEPDPAPLPDPEPAGFPGQSGSSTSPGPSQGSGHVRSAEAGGLGKGHGKEKAKGRGNSGGKGKGNGRNK